MLVLTGWRHDDALLAAEKPARPNVILIMTDDQGYGEFGFNGNPLVSTPAIDALAEQSMRLTDFHVSPMCTPTRGQLMTGLDAFRNGAVNVSSGRTLLRPELKTMANVFQEGGYRTGIFGKWHLGDNYPFRPEDRGFEEALWFPSSHINSVPDFWDNDYFSDTYIRNGSRKQIPGYCTDVFFQETMNWIASLPQGEPFFAYIPLNSAHWPWFVPEKYREPVRQSIAAHPEVVQHLNQNKIDNLVSFLAMGANIDDNIGQLDQFLRQHQLFEDTIVVFLTDNGSTMGEDYFNAGMRGKKTQLWEGGHRVPCLIRWPGGSLGSPREESSLCHVQDLLPTLADLANLNTVPEDLDGMSLAPLLREDVEVLPDRILVINYSRMPSFKVSYTKQNPSIPQRDGAAVMWKRWRLLENRMLFDLSSDPHQDHDVAAQHPEIVRKLSAHLESWWEDVHELAREPQRVIIGSEHENPQMLTACEWLDVFIDQQVQIRRGDRKNGVWYLEVAEQGKYEFELRRWPRETDQALAAGLPAVKVTDGNYIAGTAIPIHSAELKINGQSCSAEPQVHNTHISFEVELEPGPISLQATFQGAEGQDLLGAYYVYVHRR
ncbi:MAG: arylsulfatase [Planctomycetaceae bacterium]|nr:arylsulfatase [Planctomycetaceae bacterium]